MFDSFDICISGRAIGFHEIKLLICEFLHNNPILVSSWEQGIVDDYIEIMRKDRQWGSHIELNAFSEMTHMDVMFTWISMTLQMLSRLIILKILEKYIYYLATTATMMPWFLIMMKRKKKGSTRYWSRIHIS